MCSMSDDPSMNDVDPVESRSMAKRVAIQRGEEMPTFGAKADPGRDPALVVDDLLTPPERRTLIDNFIRLNPRGFRGARASDMLDMLTGVDSDLDLVEPICDANPEIPVPLLATAVRAAVLMLGASNRASAANDRVNIEALARSILRRATR